MKKLTIICILTALVLTGCQTPPDKGDFPQPEYATETTK
jgi:starvation-inducible outer membrane lipoprotein